MHRGIAIYPTIASWTNKESRKKKRAGRAARGIWAENTHERIQYNNVALFFHDGKNRNRTKKHSGEVEWSVSEGVGGERGYEDRMDLCENVRARWMECEMWKQKRWMDVSCTYDDDVDKNCAKEKKRYTRRTGPIGMGGKARKARKDRSRKAAKTT